MNAAEKAQEKAKIRQAELENMRRVVVAVIPENDQELIGVGAGRQINLNPFAPKPEVPQTPPLESQASISCSDQTRSESLWLSGLNAPGRPSSRLWGSPPILLGKRSLMNLSAGSAVEAAAARARGPPSDGDGVRGGV